MSSSYPTKPTHSRHDTALIHGLSTAEFARLTEVCTEAKSKAYCPYSKFRVGAAVLTKSGSCIAGANVENAAYPVGVCAERVALGTAAVEGARPGDIRAVAVSTDASTPSSPCGFCRQFINEFCEATTPIIMFDKDGKWVVMTVEQLLPMGFGPDQLKRDQAAAAQLEQ
ncbi:cytidine deaminase [Myriangium duriaei CBS 260.36]|uniref:Cytidine deaminase n=1 Tax=Myriangium duriaei CBS 260.36 TaxID=1168546 RepID=A0A9P4IVL0_9PEZI|nr:cytidine deaminase [Myriangium duriaei CBS 260.36]